jgi:hypothetical protein
MSAETARFARNFTFAGNAIRGLTPYTEISTIFAGNHSCRSDP